MKICYETLLSSSIYQNNIVPWNDNRLGVFVCAKDIFPRKAKQSIFSTYPIKKWEYQQNCYCLCLAQLVTFLTKRSYDSMLYKYKYKKYLSL